MTTCPWERNSPHDIVIIIEKGCFVMVFGGGTYWNQTDFFRKAGELLKNFKVCLESLNGQTEILSAK